MKKISVLVALSFGFSMLFVTPSLAATTGGQAGQGQQQQPGMQQQPGAQMQQQPRQQPGMQQQQAQMQEPLKAEDVRGKTVKGQQGEDLGEIENVMVDPQGQNSYAILAGEEDRMYPIPMNALQRGQEEDEFRVNISKDQLVNAPSFQKDSQPNLSDPQWQQTVHGYYGVQPGQQQQPGMQQRQPQGNQMRYPQQQTQQTGQQQVGQQQTPMRVDQEIIGRTLTGRQGEDLGTISEVIAGQDGQIRYVILSRGGFLGIGDDRIPIPWQIVTPGAEEDQLIANVDEQMLENAPRFTDADRPNMDDPQWEQQVHSYYGVQPMQPQQQQMQQQRQPQPGQQGTTTRQERRD